MIFEDFSGRLGLKRRNLIKSAGMGGPWALNHEMMQ